MKKIFTLIFCFAFAGLVAKTQSIQWQKLLGGTGNDQFVNFKTQQTSDGGYIVVGNTIEAGGAPGGGTGTLTGLTNNGFFDGWVIKLDASGNTTWQKLLGGNNEDRLFGAQQTADGGYIVIGYSNSSNNGTLTGVTGNGNFDGWIIKLDATGNTVWQKLFGGNDADYFFGITQTSDGGYIATGQAASSNSGTFTGITNNGGSADGWVFKMDATGTVIWQKLLGGNNGDQFREVKQTIDGGYITAGYSTSSNTGTLTGIFNNGAEDGWVVKLDASGNTTWQKLLGGNNTDYLSSIQQTTDGGYIAALASRSSNTGTLTGLINNGDFDGWVIKLDGTGNTTWQKLLGGTGDDEFYGCRQTNDGGYIITGFSISSNTGTLTGVTNHGNYDGWLIKLNAAGNTQLQQLSGGNDDDRLYTIEQTSDGGYILEGLSSSTNNGTLTGTTNNGGSDGWVLKLTQFTLPLTLGDFTAKDINNTIELDWSTQTEQNSRGFYIERSLGNTNTFLEVGFVASKAAMGNSNQKLDYSFRNSNTFIGTSYYRLKSMDNDDHSSFSKIVSIRTDKSVSISVGPNPATNFLSITSPSVIRSIKCYNVHGQFVVGISPESNSYSLATTSLKPGMYFLQVETTDGTFNKVFIR